jgi:uncharacterized SAM-binding protein YcdF (DUF218 family)
MMDSFCRGAKAAFRWLYRFAAFVGFLLILATATPVLKYWTDALSAPWGDGKGDVMVLLGAGATASDIISIGSYWRCVHAVTLWRSGHFRQVIVSGREEARLMRDFLLLNDIPAEAITMESRATSTRDNALFVAEILRAGSGRVVLMTSDYHMGRALGAFRKAGVDPSAFPLPDARKRFGDPQQRWDVFCLLLLETTKALYYRVRGWT